jgi:hypothetical protein
MDEEEEEDEDGEEEEEEINPCLLGRLGLGAITHAMQNQASRNQDEIASKMWEDYTAWIVDNDM